MLHDDLLQNKLPVMRSMSDIADILSSNGGGSLSGASDDGSLRSLSASQPPSSCNSRLECKLTVICMYVCVCVIISWVVCTVSHKYAVVVTNYYSQQALTDLIGLDILCQKAIKAVTAGSYFSEHLVDKCVSWLQKALANAFNSSTKYPGKGVIKMP